MNKAKIHYYDIGDYLSREDKLRIIKQFGSIERIPWTILQPNEHGDWINHRNEMFKLFIPIEPEKKFVKGQKSFFETYAIGVATNRDAWVYNSSQQTLEGNMRSMIDFYNKQREAYSNAIKENVNLSVEEFIDTDETKISWTRSLRNNLRRNFQIQYNKEKLNVGLYRPFQKLHIYFASELIESIGLSPKLFPTPNHKNLVICVSGIGSSKDFSVIITDRIPCLDLVEKSQCFPFYWYDNSNLDIMDLFSQNTGNKDSYERRDGISDWVLTTVRKQYGYKVAKEDIFYYVYGLLHSSEYRTMFATDLKKSLPRLPLVENIEDFWAFSKAGRELADLHLNYETIEPYHKCQKIYAPLANKGESINYHVEKMRFGKIDSKTVDKTIIYYNNAITIENIPAEAYEYVVNGKSAIEWIMERYAITTDKKSGIINDPNDWAREHNDEKYIFNLLLRISKLYYKAMQTKYGILFLYTLIGFAAIFIIYLFYSHYSLKQSQKQIRKDYIEHIQKADSLYIHWTEYNNTLSGQKVNNTVFRDSIIKSTLSNRYKLSRNQYDNLILVLNSYFAKIDSLHRQYDEKLLRDSLRLNTERELLEGQTKTMLELHYA